MSNLSMNKLPCSRINKRTLLLALLCGILLIVVVFGIVIKSVSASGSPSRSTATGMQQGPTVLPSASATVNPSNLVVSSQSITPTVTQGPKGTGTPVSGTPTGGTPTSAPSYPSSPSGSASIYYGVHVAYDSMSYVTSFEADAGKAVSIVMWYQQWGLRNGWQYIQTYWMNEVRAHGSIPMITWDPQDPSNGTANQPAYA